MRPAAFIVVLGLFGLTGACDWFATSPEMVGLPLPFDSAAWKAADANSETRCRMLADLRHRIGLIGKTEAEVVALLGEAETHDGEPTTHYHLCPSFMDTYILEIEWRDGRVVSTRARDT